MINTRKIVWLEGPDNVGKTSIIEALSERCLLELGINPLVIRQPASCALGRAVYDLHHKYDDLRIDGFARQLLHVSAHIQSYTELSEILHLTPLIWLCDRSFLSSIAYGHAFPTMSSSREFETRAIFDLETQFLPNSQKPTHVVFLQNQPFITDENESSLENTEKVRQGYDTLIKLPYVKSFLPKETFLVQNLKGKLSETVDFIFQLVVKY